jgi:hypothetical protein
VSEENPGVQPIRNDEVVTDNQSDQDNAGAQLTEVDETDSAAHPVDENPDELVGEETKDPWADKSQTDWPNTDQDTQEVNPA